MAQTFSYVCVAALLRYTCFAATHVIKCATVCFVTETSSGGAVCVSPPLRSGLSFGARVFRAQRSQPTVHPRLLRDISGALVRDAFCVLGLGTLCLLKTPYLKTISLRPLVKSDPRNIRYGVLYD
jgi:hypothetical protein